MRLVAIHSAPFWGESARLPWIVTSAPGTGLPPTVTVPSSVPVAMFWIWFRASPMEDTEPSPTTNQRSTVKLSPGLPDAARSKSAGSTGWLISACVTSAPRNGTVTPAVVKLDEPGLSWT